MLILIKGIGKKSLKGFNLCKTTPMTPPLGLKGSGGANDQPNVRFLGVVVESIDKNSNHSTTSQKDLRVAMEKCRDMIKSDSWGTFRLEITIAPANKKMNTNAKNFENYKVIYYYLLKILPAEYHQEHYDLIWAYHPDNGDLTKGISYGNHKYSWGDCGMYYGTERCGRTMAHEVYHSMGIGHASFQNAPYGNLYDVMNNYNKQRLGLAMRHKIGFLPSSLLYTVDPWNSSHTGLSWNFSSFEKPTSDKVGVRIKLRCAEIYVSRDDNDRTLVEYAVYTTTDVSSMLATTFKYDDISYKTGFLGNYEMTQNWKINETYYDTLGKLTLTRTARGVSVQLGGSRGSATYSEPDLPNQYLNTRTEDRVSNLTTGCGKPKKLTSNCSKGSMEQFGYPLTWLKSGYRAQRTGYLGTVEYECREGTLEHLTGIWGPQECSNLAKNS